MDERQLCADADHESVWPWLVGSGGPVIPGGRSRSSATAAATTTRATTAAPVGIVLPDWERRAAAPTIAAANRVEGQDPRCPEADAITMMPASTPMASGHQAARQRAAGTTAAPAARASTAQWLCVPISPATKRQSA